MHDVALLNTVKQLGFERFHVSGLESSNVFIFLSNLYRPGGWGVSRGAVSK